MNNTAKIPAPKAPERTGTRPGPGFSLGGRMLLTWMILITLVATGLLSGCQPTPVETPTPLIPSPIPSTATSPPTIPPSPTLPAPTDTAQPTPIPPTQPAPTQALTTGMVLNLPGPGEGVPSISATTVISVRTGPALEYPVYGLLLEGQAAELIGISENREWWAINVPGVPLSQGWVYSAYVETSSAEQVTVISPPPIPPILVFSNPSADSSAPFVRFRETLYARSGPGVEYPAYGVILQGQEAQATHITQDGNWYQVLVYSNQVPTRQAWVPAPFVEARRGSAVAIGSAQPAPLTVELPAPPEEATKGIPMTPIYLRDGPGLEYAVFGVVAQANPLEITGASPNREWLQIAIPITAWPSGTAWVPAAFIATQELASISEVTPPALTQEVVAFEPGVGDSWARPLENLYFFAGPGVEYGTPGYLPANQKAVLSGVNRAGDWYIVRVPLTVLESGQGWVRADLVETLIQSSLPIIEPPAN